MLNTSLQAFLQWKYLISFSLWQHWAILMSHTQASNTLQAGFIVWWWKVLYAFNKSCCQGKKKTSMDGLKGSYPASEMTSEVKCYASLSEWLILLQRAEIKYSFFPPFFLLLTHLRYGENCFLLPQHGLLCDSYDVTWFSDLILSICQSQAATSGFISTAVTEM